MRVYSGVYDKWYVALVFYVEAVLKAVVDDEKFNETYALTNLTPNLTTRTALKNLNAEHNPTGIFLDLEAAIRMEFFDFKGKWDAALAS